MFPAASAEGSSGAKTAVVGTADCGVNGCRYVLVARRKLKNQKRKKKNTTILYLKSGILLKSLSHRSNNEVTYHIIVLLKLTHSIPSQRQKRLFGRKKGNFGIFDGAFYFPSSFISTVLNNSLETGWSVIFHALKSAWFYHQQAQTQNPAVSQW